MAALCKGSLLSELLGRNIFLCAPCVLPLLQQTRNTFILKRRWPPGLAKIGQKPKLKSRHFVYDLVEDTNIKKNENLEVILTSYVKGLGDVGDVVSVKRNYAYDQLLLPGLAVYSSPENIAKFSDTSKVKSLPTFSSPTAEKTIQILSKLIVAVVMSKENPWTIELWHIRMSFRKAGVRVPENAIEMPEKPISGPNLDLEGKEFTVTITVNKREKVPVKCRVHHWSTNPSDRLPFIKDHWLLPAEALFPEHNLSHEDPATR